MIYKVLYYRLYKSIEQLGGGVYTLRTNGLLSFIVTLNFAFALSIFVKITGYELEYTEIIIAIFLAGIFILNYIKFIRGKRYIRLFEELEVNITRLAFKSILILTIAIVLTVVTFTIAIVI